MKILRGILRVLIVLWAGSLWSLLWVAMTLFHTLSDRHLAGVIAAKLFSMETYLGLLVAAPAIILPARSRYWVYFAAAVLALNEWVLKRIMSAAQAHGSAAGLGFGTWHGVSAALYLLACLCAVVVIYRDES